MFDDVHRQADRGVAPGDAVVAPAARPRRCGFRFSAADAAVIAACGLATWLLWDALGDMAMLFPVVLAHFFLFCNVFRVRRGYELAWAVAFVLNVAAWQVAGAFAWRNVLLAQTPLTVALIAAEMMSLRYHGVGCAWINPSAPAGPPPAPRA